MYIFPYKFVKQNSKIIIYGGGAVGRDFIRQIKNSGYCEIVCVLDRNAKNIKISGIQVLLPEAIVDVVNYDLILIALDSFEVAVAVEKDLIRLGVDNRKIINNKIERLIFNINDTDKRLIRLEILQYYSIPENLSKLNDEQKETLLEVQNYYNMEHRFFKEDPYYLPSHAQQSQSEDKWKIFEEDNGLFYILVGGKKLYISDNKNWTAMFLDSLKDLEAENFPHRYLNPDKDGIDVPNNAVLLDIGACEGYFGLKYLDRCKKVYFFESEFIWIERLEQTFAEYSDKVEIVPQMVGDIEDCLNLDEYFSNREKFNFVKIDVEGMEGAVLRSMRRMIESDNPLTLLIATYHRQDDWDRYEKFLNPVPNNPRFDIYPSDGYYWHMPDAKPPFFRRGIMRARKLILKNGVAI